MQVREHGSPHTHTHTQTDRQTDRQTDVRTTTTTRRSRQFNYALFANRTNQPTNQRTNAGDGPHSGEATSRLARTPAVTALTAR